MSGIPSGAARYTGEAVVPPNWWVREMGQDPVHMLWFCVMLCNPRDGVWLSVSCEDCANPIEAMQVCIGKIRGGDIRTHERGEQDGE